MFVTNQDEVNRVFSSVAKRYDIMNDIMSLGLHRLWKRLLCSEITKSHSSLLDVAGGTGDIAIKAASKRNCMHVTVCDINMDMLKIGRRKAVNNGHLSINWVCSSGECLPFLSDTFDYYTIAFGIRNIPDRKAALKEAYRVLGGCGRLLCLEFSPLVGDSILKTAYDFYSLYVIPQIGRVVAQDMDAYSYFVSSIRKFPIPEQFAQEITDAGFFMVTHRNICQGIATLYSAWKP